MMTGTPSQGIEQDLGYGELLDSLSLCSAYFTLTHTFPSGYLWDFMFFMLFPSQQLQGHMKDEEASGAGPGRGLCTCSSVRAGMRI